MTAQMAAVPDGDSTVELDLGADIGALADDNVQGAALRVHVEYLLDDLVGDEEVLLVGDGDGVLEFVVGPAAGYGLHLTPDAFDVEGEELFFAVGRGGPHHELVLIENLH